MGSRRSAAAPDSSASGRRDPAGRILAAGAAGARRRAGGARGRGRNRDGRLGRHAGRRADDAERPRRLDRLRARRARRRLARRLRVAARPRLQPRGLAAAGDGARGRSHRPAGERRPLVHCRDRRGGARRVSARRWTRSRPRVVFANEAEAALVGQIDGRAGRRQARRRGLRRPRRRRQRGASRRSRPRSSTRPAPETRSRQASSLGGRRPRARRRRPLRRQDGAMP